PAPLAEGDPDTDLVRVGVVEAPTDVVHRVPRVGYDRDRAGRPVGEGEPLAQLTGREGERIGDVLAVGGALYEADRGPADLPLLGGGERFGLRGLRDELRLPRLEDLLLRVPSVREADPDEGNAARDRKTACEPSGSATEPAGPQQPHRLRRRLRAGGGLG